MSWIIVSDSSCELRSLENPAPDLSFATVPLKIRVGDREFVDNSALDVDAMIDAMHNYNGASTTACPSPEEWAEKFMQADNILAITISSNLSGSYNSAMVAREMVLESHPEKRIHVLDSLSTGGEMALAIWKANDLVASGLPFDEVVREWEIWFQGRQVLFALASFDNLVKNGRLSRLAGFMAGVMNMRAVGRGSEEGKLEMLHKTRGETRMLALLLEEMDHRGYQGLEPAVISHCQNEKAALMLKNGIEKKWPGAKVVVLPCSGLTSFYAETGGIIVGY